MMPEGVAHSSQSVTLLHIEKDNSSMLGQFGKVFYLQTQ